ncbi:histidine kinase [Streptomyces sp. B1866]|uniref:sensor histidine kinase n=1 Tax=Streptomyces sp. B1866 TaxID=3075431 RepID=UPI002890BD43|nr:histidine kinase [Streptomyces sp. B1866]MDT3397591.1 histidine kinase [Streptomyces sp. B1866]
MSGTGAARAAGAGRGPGGPWWWARRRAMVLDVSLAAVSAAECAAEGVDFSGQAHIPTALGVLFGAVVGATLLVRRRWPIVVVLVAIAVTPAEMGLLLGVVGLYSLAASELPRRITAVLAGMSGLAALIILLVRFHQAVAEDEWDPPFWVIPVLSVLTALGVTAPPVLLGLYVGARRRLVESLRERADGLERELSLLAERAEERAEWARGEERRRIAREMHDVVAHRVSLMVVHAAALQAVAVKDPEKASRNAALVGDMGRQALTELRQMLGVLRSEPGPGEGGAGEARGAAAREPVPLAVVAAAASAAAGGTGAAEAAGGPSLGELESLVGQSRAAGMAVELSVEGEARPYAPRVERAAYRVVQEALTNVHKHAPGAWARVRLAYRGAEVAVLVENGPSEGGAADAGLPSGGNGLVGMRERVTTLGGGFVSGVTAAGGFRVSAVIPDRAEEGAADGSADGAGAGGAAGSAGAAGRAEPAGGTGGAAESAGGGSGGGAEAGRAQERAASGDRAGTG